MSDKSPAPNGLYFGYCTTYYYGKRVGYDLLPSAVKKMYCSSIKELTFNRFRRRVDSILTKSTQTLGIHRIQRALFQRRLSQALLDSNFSYAHGLWADFTPVLSVINRTRSIPVIVTAHTPLSYWDQEKLQILKNIDALILLYGQGAQDFRSIRPNLPVYSTRYGIDTAFFQPRSRPREENRVLIVGAYLRNFTLIADLLRYFSNSYPSTLFDIVIPSHLIPAVLLEEFGSSPHINWLENLTDEELLTVYQRASILCLPIIDGGANNAVVEALATGTPILSTDFPGVRDYGGNQWIKTVPTQSSITMIEELLGLLRNRELRCRMSEEGRRFALSHLDWSVVAEKHMDIYRDVITSYKSHP